MLLTIPMTLKFFLLSDLFGMVKRYKKKQFGVPSNQNFENVKVFTEPQFREVYVSALKNKNNNSGQNYPRIQNI